MNKNLEVIADLQKVKNSKLSKDLFLSKYSNEVLWDTISFIKRHQKKYFDTSSEVFLITKVLELQTLISETKDYEEFYIKNLQDLVN